MTHPLSGTLVGVSPFLTLTLAPVPSPGFIFHLGCWARPQILAPPPSRLEVPPLAVLLLAPGLLHLQENLRGYLGQRGGPETGSGGCCPGPWNPSPGPGVRGAPVQPSFRFPSIPPCTPVTSKNGHNLPRATKGVILELGSWRPPTWEFGGSPCPSPR